MKLATAILGLAAAGLTGCGAASQTTQPQNALPTIYILDSGTTGWVKVYYNHPDETELPLENGFAVARIGQELKLFTRNRMNPSWDGSQFYYLAADGKRVALSSADSDSRLIWAQEKTSNAAGEYETFYVGNQEQLSQELSPKFTGGIIGQPANKTDPHDKPDDPSKVFNELPR